MPNNDKATSVIVMPGVCVGGVDSQKESYGISVITVQNQAYTQSQKACYSLSVLMTIFSRFSGLASTRMCPFRIFLELRMMEVVVTTGAIRRAKLQSKCHHQQSNIQFLFTGRMPFLSSNQQCQSTEGKTAYACD